MTLKVRTTALFIAPAALKMSKLDRTPAPLTATLKTLAPLAEKTYSAKWSRSWYEPPGASPEKL